MLLRLKDLRQGGDHGLIRFRKSNGGGLMHAP